MLCSMCPSVVISPTHGPRKGWVCQCKEVNCSHYLACPRCGANRYEQEKGKTS
jgi:hypothetical protein